MAGLWSVALRAALRAYARMGLDADRVCRDSGIDPSVLDDPEARVPLERTGRIWPAAQSQWDRPGLGLHAGANTKFGDLELLDYTVAAAPTLGDGLRTVARYFEIASEGVSRLSLRDGREPGTSEFCYFGAYSDDLRDYAMVAIQRRMQHIGFVPLRMELSGRPCAPLDEYARLLPCPVEFDREDNCLVFDDATLERPLESELHGLADIVEREAQRMLARLHAPSDPRADLRAQVARMLQSGRVGIDSLASRLGMSRRSLQRQLEKHDTTFSDLLDEVRCDLSQELIREGRQSVSEVAFMLGYSEPSTFSRAFKRWTGRSPSEFRRALVN